MEEEMVCFHLIVALLRVPVSSGSVTAQLRDKYSFYSGKLNINVSSELNTSISFKSAFASVLLSVCGALFIFFSFKNPLLRWPAGQMQLKKHFSSGPSPFSPSLINNFSPKQSAFCPASPEFGDVPSMCRFP
jgi:hypothetical protein